jgi:hypothetical protein
MENDMANKLSIQDVDAQLDRNHRKLTILIGRIDRLRKLRKKIILGYVKRVEPPGRVVKITKGDGVASSDEFGDLIPSFGPGAQ